MRRDCEASRCELDATLELGASACDAAVGLAASGRDAAVGLHAAR
jgi:hypothetical protein